MSQTLPIYQVDAFTNDVFGGNPAAVVPLDTWLNDTTLMNIAAENNLSETAFFVPSDNGFHLRWFTPTDEVNLCGHATLATSHVLFSELGYDKDSIHYETLSGILKVEHTEDGYMLNLPAWDLTAADIDPRIAQAFGKECVEFYSAKILVAVYDDPSFIRHCAPDLSIINQIPDCEGVIVTAKGDEDYDCVSRYFAPQIGIDEDPVTGAAHCLLAPFWAKKLGKNSIRAYQASARGGEVLCEVKDDRVYMHGAAKTYMQGQIFI